jgi:hypothetical protein
MVANVKNLHLYHHKVEVNVRSLHLHRHPLPPNITVGTEKSLPGTRIKLAQHLKVIPETLKSLPLSLPQRMPLLFPLLLPLLHRLWMLLQHSPSQSWHHLPD